MAGIADNRLAPDWGQIERDTSMLTADALQLVYALVQKEINDRLAAVRRIQPGSGRYDRVALMGIYGQD